MAAVERLHAGGFAVSELTVGRVSIKLGRAAPAGDRDQPQPDGVYQQYGGQLLAQVAAEVLPGVDLQPAIGRRAG